MTTTEQVQKVVADFIKAGDTNDGTLLEQVLHARYQNVQDGFFEKEGIYVFSKDEYKQLVESKRFGGSNRTITYKTVNVYGNLAQAEVQLENTALIFNSTIVLCHEGGGWKVIHNIPRIQKK